MIHKMLQINFIKKMNIFANLHFKFMRKNCIVISVRQQLYILITFAIVLIINENMIMKYITLH